MATFGISVYPDLRPMDEIVAYFDRAAAHGFTRVFTSFFSAEGNNDEVAALFRRFIDEAHARGLAVSLDVNPACFRRFGACCDDASFFAELGCDILRLDGDFSPDENLTLLRNPYGMAVEFNASAVSPESVAQLIERGADPERLLVCHNFYPQRYTGFRWDRFLELNRAFARLGVRVGAFVASHAPNTHGVWDARDGLPTVERLRDYSAELAARIMLATGDVTDIFFGNAYASDAELEALAQAGRRVEPDPNGPVAKALREIGGSTAEKLLASDARQVRVKVEPDAGATAVEREILFGFYPHVDMGDSSEWMWRSRLPRLFFQDRTIAPRPFAGDEFLPGDVVMVNDSYKHYAGEVQVVLLPMRNDGQRNRVGHINEQEFELMQLVRDGDVLVFDHS